MFLQGREDTARNALRRATERHNQQAVTNYARQIKNQTGCSWGDAIATAEARILGESGYVVFDDTCLNVGEQL